MTVLITGVTGNVGRELVQALLARGQSVKAAARDAARVEALAEREGWSGDISTVSLDYGDPESIRAALDGADRVFLVTPTLGPVIEMVRAFLPIAREAGVRQIVRLSGMRTVDEASPTHAECEALIAHSGIPYTHLRPNFYMQNFSTFYAEGIRARDSIALPAGTEPISFIDVRDIADAAAVIFTEDGHNGRTYTLTGGEAITHADVARLISEAVGREIRYVDMPEAQFRDVMQSAGRPDSAIDGILYLYAPVKQQLAAPVTPDLTRITGQPPRTFAQYAHDYASVWRP